MACMGEEDAMKCLVAVDGSKHAEQALHAVSNFSLGCRIVLLHAVDPARAYPVVGIDVPVFPTQSFEQELRRAGEGILERAKHEVESLGFQTTTQCPFEYPAEAILSAAEAEKVDLIVMGARGLGTIEEWTMGSVSHQVLPHATCPVLVVRAPVSRFGRVLVAVETGADVERMVAFLASRVFRDPPELEIVAALPESSGLYSDADSANAHYRKPTEAIQELARRVSALGYRARSTALKGAAGEVIAREAAERKIDLILIGSRGRSAWSRFFLGSVGHSILHRAPCPVLVVKRDGKPGAAAHEASAEASLRSD